MLHSGTIACVQANGTQDNKPFSDEKTCTTVVSQPHGSFHRDCTCCTGSGSHSACLQAHTTQQDTWLLEDILKVLANSGSHGPCLQAHETRNETRHLVIRRNAFGDKKKCKTVVSQQQKTPITAVGTQQDHRPTVLACSHTTQQANKMMTGVLGNTSTSGYSLRNCSSCCRQQPAHSHASRLFKQTNMLVAAKTLDTCTDCLHLQLL
jgi:hypothetical protein